MNVGEPRPLFFCRCTKRAWRKLENSLRLSRAMALLILKREANKSRTTNVISCRKKIANLSFSLPHFQSHTMFACTACTHSTNYHTLIERRWCQEKHHLQSHIRRRQLQILHAARRAHLKRCTGLRCIRAKIKRETRNNLHQQRRDLMHRDDSLYVISFNVWRGFI